jgi:flagellar protein FlaJ
MTEASSKGGFGYNEFVTLIADVAEAYDDMEMAMERYLFVVMFPAVTFFFATVLAAVRFPLPMMARVPLPMLGLLGIGVAIAYPKIAQDKQRAEMSDRMHLFITHMTILSQTNIDRMAVFRTLANEKEYAALAEEMRRIVELVDTWNQSLDDACRMRAKRVPDEDVADFFERMAYVLRAGQDIGEFLLSEQDAVIRSFTTRYESSLDNLEVLKDLYLSMILSATFALVFATVLPILSGNNPTVMVSSVLVLFLIIQSVFLYVVKLMTPKDPIWYLDPDKLTDFEKKAIVALGISLVLVAAIFGFMLASLFGYWPATLFEPRLHTRIPRIFWVPIPLTPLLIPGILFRQEEERVCDRDKEFANFIRALGSSESVKQATTSEVLKTLRKRDFDPLSPNIDDLYKRLNMRLDTHEAWKLFMTEAHSNLIQKFSEMYVVGREMGGDPQVLGELISKNMNEVLQLRRQRSQSATTLVGLLYGITAAASFAFFIGFEVVGLLADLSLGLETPELNIGELIHPDVYNMPLIHYLIILIVLSNAFLSSMMIRITDGGHYVNAYLHFVLLAWLGSAVGWFTGKVVGSILSF